MKNDTNPFNPANIEANAGLAATLWHQFCELTKVDEGNPALDWWGFKWAAYAMAGLEALPRESQGNSEEAAFRKGMSRYEITEKLWNEYRAGRESLPGFYGLSVDMQLYAQYVSGHFLEQLNAAQNEIECSDDVRLDQGLAVAISDLQRARKAAEASNLELMGELERERSENTKDLNALAVKHNDNVELREQLFDLRSRLAEAEKALQGMVDEFPPHNICDNCKHTYCEGKRETFEAARKIAYPTAEPEPRPIAGEEEK